MKAYHFQLLVDCYGDIPYSEALGRSLNATPKYDDAQTVYNDLIVQLTNAIALLTLLLTRQFLVQMMLCLAVI